MSRALEAFGLGRSTSQLYCAALKLGPARPGEIIRSARVRRATGYRGLQRLRRMELLTPTRNRPSQREALPLARFLDRSANALLDEADLHQELETVAGETLGRPESVRRPPPSRLFGSKEAGAILGEGLLLSRREILLMPLLRMLMPDARAVLRQGLEDALDRGVRVQMLIPHQSAYLRLLTGILPHAQTDSALLIHVCEPAFFHLYVVDSTRAIRMFVRTTVSGRPAHLVGILSERRAFVQAQEQRFRALWSESPDFEPVT